MAYDHQRGREDLVDFEATQPANFFAADLHLQRVLGRWGGPAWLERWRGPLERFGADCATIIDAAVRQNNLTANLPALERFTAVGERCEEVAHHPSFHLAGRAIYGSGMMAALAEPGGNLAALSHFYLSSHVGEAGHNCPLACTAGVIKVLGAVGGDELKARYLGRLISADYSELAHGAQFLTEVQGGSDVGANSVVAEPEPEEPGVWRLRGEKWFCSNVTADLCLVTARPGGASAGTRGLGLFLMPRRLADGSLNRFFIRRLKDKIGTRTLPTAELDLDGALAWQVGPLADGFRNVMTYVINTSRIFNALGCAGMAHRACLVAHGFAARRQAFGAAIGTYPMTQATLAMMRAETAAMVSGSFYLVQVLDRLERGELGGEAMGFVRLALNLNKRRAALSAHEVINAGIEVLAGNGTIETFSVLPRLLRDNVVFENWEGSHNVLLLQAWRDSASRGLHRAFFTELAALAAPHAELRALVDEARGQLAEMAALDASLVALRLPALGDRLVYLLWAAAMANDGTPAAVLEHFLARRLRPPAPADAGFLARVREVSAEP